MVGHVSPEAVAGGPIALLRDGDVVTIDVDAQKINVNVDLEARRGEFMPRPVREAHGAYAKYRQLVGSASRGAVTIPLREAGG